MIRCVPCSHDRHEQCQLWVPTGRRVPDPDPHRDRDQMVAEFVPCTCGCQDIEVPW
jgi:hypothetical protein